jgi:hypothetical protein
VIKSLLARIHRFTNGYPEFQQIGLGVLTGLSAPAVIMPVYVLCHWRKSSIGCSLHYHGTGVCTRTPRPTATTTAEPAAFGN